MNAIKSTDRHLQVNKTFINVMVKQFKNNNKNATTKWKLRLENLKHNWQCNMFVQRVFYFSIKTGHIFIIDITIVFKMLFVYPVLEKQYILIMVFVRLSVRPIVY